MRVRPRHVLAALVAAVALAVALPWLAGHPVGGWGNGVGGSPIGCMDGAGQAANHDPNCP